MQLQARKQRQLSARATRRQRQHQYQQRGGATWESIYDGFGDRKDKWQAEFANDPYKALFGAIFTVPDLGDEGSLKIRLEQWVNCMMYQEQLFDIAYKLYEENGDAVEYFADAARMINFTFTPDTAGQSKFDLIYNGINDKSSDESKITKDILKYFKTAFSNSFITSLASIINMLKSTKGKADDQLTTVEKGALARYFSSLTSANAWLLTGYDLIDGFFVDQDQTQFKQHLTGGNVKGTSLTFYDIFIEELKDATTPADSVNKLNTVDFRDKYKVIWPMLAAIIAKLHMEDKVSTVLTLFTAFPDSGESDKKFFEYNDAILYIRVPNKDLMLSGLPNNLNIYNIMRQLTVGMLNIKEGKDLFKRIPGDAILQFIVHLSKRCVELEQGKDFVSKTASDFFTGPAAASSAEAEAAAVAAKANANAASAPLPS